MTSEDFRLMGQTVRGLIKVMLGGLVIIILSAAGLGWYLSNAIGQMEEAVAVSEELQENVERLLEDDLPVVVFYESTTFGSAPDTRETYLLTAEPCLVEGVTAARLRVSTQYFFPDGAPPWASQAVYEREPTFTDLGDLPNGLPVDDRGCRPFIEAAIPLPDQLINDLADNPDETPTIAVRYRVRVDDLSDDGFVTPGRTIRAITDPWTIPAAPVG